MISTSRGIELDAAGLGVPLGVSSSFSLDHHVTVRTVVEHPRDHRRLPAIDAIMDSGALTIHSTDTQAVKNAVKAERYRLLCFHRQLDDSLLQRCRAELQGLPRSISTLHASYTLLDQ